MNIILNVKQAMVVSKKIRRRGESLVLAGGCFDILHLGHVKFLEAAKKQGDCLFVFLESDGAVRRKKGKNRPINPQDDRAKVLTALRSVDYVIMLPPHFADIDYDNLVQKLKPDVIATTKGDPQRFHKERQIKLTQTRLIDVIERIPDKSSTKLAQLFPKELL